MDMITSLPNLLTLSRIIAVPVLVAALWGHGWLGSLVAFILFCLLGITDYFDGYLARAQGTVSRLGQFLDPVADKIMVAAVIVMLLASQTISGWHVVAAMIILLREITVSGLREFLAGVQVSVPVSRLAKWKTAFQMIALGGLILVDAAGALVPWLPAYPVGIICLWTAAALTLLTGYDYLRAGIKHMA